MSNEDSIIGLFQLQNLQSVSSCVTEEFFKPWTAADMTASTAFVVHAFDQRIDGASGLC